MQNVLRNNPDMHVFAEVHVAPGAEAWLRDVAAQGYTIRYCDHDGSTPELDRRAPGARRRWMAYIHREDR